MNVLKRCCPAWLPVYRAAARAYALDLAASALLFFAVSLAAGRVWRFPFDDEVYNLDKLERFSARELLTIYLTGHDVHPPLSYLAFKALDALGLGEAGMRLCSLAMTALALALFHWLTLAWIAERRDGEAVPPVTRLIALVMFGLSPLAVSQGDALRWYPLFALEIALAVALYLGGTNGAARLWSAVVLGIAASTNFLAAFVLAPLALYRYGLQRRFCPRFDAAFWLMVLGFGSLGIFSALYLFLNNSRMVGTQFIGGVAQAALTDALGFFGGHALGLGQAWLVAPAAVIGAAAAWSAIDRKRPDDPAHLLLLMLATAAALPFVGFAKPRSFLYLAPVLAALLTLFLDRLAVRRPGLALLLAALLTGTAAAAIANIKDGVHPFKRNTAIPFGTVVDFIGANAQGRMLVLSTDPVVPWLLRHRAAGGEACIAYFRVGADCIENGARFDTVFIIHGHSDKIRYPRTIAWFAATVAEVTVGRSKRATLHAGVDEDAALKTRLTGVPLDRHILTIDFYR